MIFNRPGYQEYIGQRENRAGGCNAHSHHAYRLVYMEDFPSLGDLQGGRGMERKGDVSGRDQMPTSKELLFLLLWMDWRQMDTI